jgi:dihydroorotase
MSINPRRILSQPVPAIEEGAVANLTIFAPEERWIVDTTKFKTMSLNTPFNGWELKGKPIAIANRGAVVWSEL